MRGSGSCRSGVWGLLDTGYKLRVACLKNAGVNIWGDEPVSKLNYLGKQPVFVRQVGMGQQGREALGGDALRKRGRWAWGSQGDR